MTFVSYHGQSCLTRISSSCLLLKNYVAFFFKANKMYSLLQYPLSLLNEVLSQWQAVKGIISNQGVKLFPIISRSNGTGSSITSKHFSQGDRSTPFFS